jgi:hypothetical protein
VNLARVVHPVASLAEPEVVPFRVSIGSVSPADNVMHLQPAARIRLRPPADGTGAMKVGPGYEGGLLRLGHAWPPLGPRCTAGTDPRT